MSPRQKAAIRLVTLLGVGTLLLVLFPAAFAFVQLAARELRYLWWLILLLALAVWLIWGINRKP